MELYAAVDVLEGRSVRLLRGSYEERTDYGDPLCAALKLAGAGPAWLHLVDLAAARDGRRSVSSLVSEVISRCGVPVQVGGGIRTERDAKELLSMGASRVVLGTAALADPSFAGRLAHDHPNAVAVALDHRGPPSYGLASSGWLTDSGSGLLQCARVFEEIGVSSLVVTSIERDGTLSGPDLHALGAVLAETDSVEVVASGGVSGPEDLEKLRSLRVGSRSLSGVIVGKALHDGRMDIGEAVAICATSG